MSPSKFVPREYQLRAIEATVPHDGFALLMQQRTGKTLVALWVRERWKSLDTLIVCPKKAIPVWEGCIRDLGINPAPFLILNFEQLPRQIKDLSKVKWDLVIVDESHRIKERGSGQTKNCWKLGKNARKRLILTGSPQGNGMEDYYSQLRFIRNDLLHTWGDFSERYLIIEEKYLPGRDDPFPKIVGYKNQPEFQEILKGISFRVTRDEVSVVPTRVRHQRVDITPSEVTMQHYAKLEKDLFTVVDGDTITAPQALVKALKLHQFCGGFIKDDLGEIHRVGTEKMDKLEEMLDGELKGENVVIVAQYKAEMDCIALLLDARGITYAQIRGKHQYDREDRSQVTIMHPSAGEAINLAHNRHMVIYSMGHSYLRWTQFIDRIVLVDTPWVKYYYLMMRGMMDELVYSSVKNKHRLSEEVLSVYKKG